MKTSTKYWKVYKRFLENSFSYHSQYRSDTILNLILNLSWMAVVFLAVEIFFGNTTLLAGWTRGETYILTLFWMISDELCIFFFSNNIYTLSSKIIEGDMDKLLTKPINTLFFVSTQFVGLRSLIRIFIQIFALVYIIIHFQITFTTLNLLLGVFFLFCGVLIQYSFMLLMNTLNFWFEKVDNINNLWDIAQGAGKYPIDIFKKSFRILFLTFLPIAYVAYFPAKSILGKISWIEVLIIPCITLFLFLLAVSFWNFALKRYTSASS